MRMSPGFQETLCNLAAILLLLSPTVTESVAELQSRFDRETDSVRKAKILVRLGDAQFEEARRAGKEGDDNTVGFTLEKYRDNVRDAIQALKKQHPDAERHSNGYRQLQMHLRNGIREVEDAMLAAPAPYKPPLQIVRQDLIAMDEELIKLLFPRRPADHHPPNSSAGETTMKLKSPIVLLFSYLLLASLPISAKPPQQKDYLTPLEADKIRDAENNTNERIRLFLIFAEDRLKKFQYELEHPSQNRHAEMLNALLNAYIGCVDDAADLIQLGIEKQENIRKGIDLLASRTKDFLPILEKLAASGTELESYRDNLQDAIEGTRDAMNDAEKAKKKVAPPPVRRKN